MKKPITVLVSVIALILLSGTVASAHNMEVRHPVSGEVIQEQWVGGPLLPEEAQGQGLAGHPSGLNQPAGHANGLVSACSATANSVVTILAPPQFTTCVHGNP